MDVKSLRRKISCTRVKKASGQDAVGLAVAEQCQLDRREFDAMISE